VVVLVHEGEASCTLAAADRAHARCSLRSEVEGPVAPYREGSVLDPVAVGWVDDLASVQVRSSFLLDSVLDPVAVGRVDDQGLVRPSLPPGFLLVIQEGWRSRSVRG